MRQRSIALVTTFIWSRLTCPALAKRQAEPWSRKMSATSSDGRAIRRRYAGGPSFDLSLRFRIFRCGCDSCVSGLSTAAIMPVATRV